MPRRSRKPFLLLALLPAFFLLRPATAAAAPQITKIFPAGGQQGHTLDADLNGVGLLDVRQILLSGEGVTVEMLPPSPRRICPVRFTLAANAEPGEREIRVVTSTGVSNAGHFWVGLYPDQREQEPNDAPGSAQSLVHLPAAINGALQQPQDVDCYGFTGVAGETWVFQMASARYHSATDGCLSLVDGHGKHLRTAMDTFGRDPRLVYTLPATGRYTLRVCDSLYRGGAGFTYRVTVGKLPVITRWSPLAGQRGERLRVTLQGVNLAPGLSEEVQLPTDPTRNVSLLVAPTPAGPAGPVPIFLESAPDVSEREPNNSRVTATPLTSLPALASGRIDENGDRDLFAFPAAEKQVVTLSVRAQRLGSRLDPVLRVLDAAGKEVAANDDAVGKDARVTFTAPTAGQYFAELRSVSSVGGDEYYYLLRIGGPPPADFRLAITPDSLTVPAGAAVAGTLRATRTGYNGPISVRVEGLPAGVTASPISLGVGESSTVFTLSAATGTTPAWGQLRVLGSAKIGAQDVERVAVGEESYQPVLTTTPKDQRTGRPSYSPPPLVRSRSSPLLCLPDRWRCR